MREIGSEFWDVPISEERNGLFPKSTQWFLSGRSALHAIIKELKGCHTVSMPDWCCDSMIKPFIDAGIETVFYPSLGDSEIKQAIISSCDSALVMDYFGYSTQDNSVKDYDGIVIRDTTHSLFSFKYEDADYFFGSLRKWCGVWTGGYAWTKDGSSLPEENSNINEYVSLRKTAMKMKSEYLKGLGVADKSYLDVFEEAEEMLEDIGIAPATNRDIELAQSIDGGFIKTRRRENAKVLRDSFSEWLVFPEMNESDCPMFVPILVPDGKRDELRRYLIKKEIYCPIHWPISEYHQIDKVAREFYSNELSLVCDQRYSIEDMFRIVDTIKDYWKGK